LAEFVAFPPPPREGLRQYITYMAGVLYSFIAAQRECNRNSRRLPFRMFLLERYIGVQLPARQPSGNDLVPGWIGVFGTDSSCEPVIFGSTVTVGRSASSAPAKIPWKQMALEIGAPARIPS